MSRSGYSEDCSGSELIKWRGAVYRATMPEEHEGFVGCSACDEATLKAGWEAPHAPMPVKWRLCKNAERAIGEYR